MRSHWSACLKPIAILSDVHGNLEALNAVLADIERQKVDGAYCLGDVVGYGPNPRECLRVLREREVPCLAGNHELAVADEQFLADMATYGLVRRAVEWTRSQLEPEDMAFIRRMPYTMDFPSGITLVHGSLNDPHDFHYMEAEPADGGENMWETFLEFAESARKHCFTGHSHRPLVWGFVAYQEEHVDVPRNPRDKDTATGRYKVRIDKYERIIASVGSVGQPRDDDPRACYVLFDGKTVTFRRIPYNVLKTASRIYAVPELDNRLGDRLFVGG